MTRFLCFLFLLIPVGCGGPTDIFQDPAGSSGGSGTAGTAGTASDGAGGQGGSGMGQGGAGGGNSGSGGSGNGSTGTGCVSNGCPSVSYCGDWNDGCGNVVVCQVEGGDPCPGNTTCDSNHQCQPCTATKTPAVVCQPNNCGAYLDECGDKQYCVPQPNNGADGCPEHQFCSSGDPPWVPDSIPVVDWSQVGQCRGCTGSAVNYCGASSKPHTWHCPVAYFDNVQDMTETDVDCGGFNPMKCDVGQLCLENSDCKGYRCIGGTCASTAFTNPEACDQSVNSNVCCP